MTFRAPDSSQGQKREPDLGFVEAMFATSPVHPLAVDDSQAPTPASSLRKGRTQTRASSS